MSVNIPDKVYKLLVLIGVLLVGYSFYETEKKERDYFEEINRFDDIQDSLIVANFTRNYKLKRIERTSERISQRYGVDNPLISVDSTLHFTRILKGSKQELIVSDSIDILWEKFQLYEFKVKLLEKKQSTAFNRLESAEKLKKSYLTAFKDLSITGLILLSVGLLIWMLDYLGDILENRKSKKQFEQVYSSCQSCGKRFSSMLKYGKNKTKDYNYAFCENCFKNGKFTNLELTREQVVATAKETIRHKNWFYTKLIQYRLSNLERWKKNEY